MKEYIIETERLRLRRLEDSDFDNLKAILSDSETMSYYPEPYDDHGVQRWINWNKGLYEERGFGLFAVELKENCTFIGDCGITMQNIDGKIVPEIGYHVNKKYWKNGYASEASQACKEWIFSNSDFTEIYSYMNTENIGSRKVAENNGMSLVKEYYKGDEHLSVYRITKDEYEKSLLCTR